MSPSIIALAVLVALAAGCGALGLAVRDIVSRRKGEAEEAPGASGPEVLRRLPRPARQAAPTGKIGAFDSWFLQLLRESGLSLNPAAATLLLLFCALLLGGSLFLWQEHPVALTVGCALGMGGVLVVLTVYRRQRIKRLQEQLPTALEMLARGVRAGESLDQAMQFTGDRSPEPLAFELRWCSRQLAMGLALPAVMRSLVDRVRLPDIRVLTTTLVVHRQAGGNLARILERLAAVVRDRLSYRRQLRAVTAAGRLSAVLVGSIGPLLFAYLFFFHTHYVRAMLDSPLGQSLLLSAVVLEIVGLIWTARILKPHY